VSTAAWRLEPNKKNNITNSNKTDTLGWVPVIKITREILFENFITTTSSKV
jgi:hypothetical protein